MICPCKDEEDIKPKSLPAQEALNILCDALLGPDWYCVDPLGVEQVNEIIVYEILKKYRKKIKHWPEGYEYMKDIK